MFSSALIKHHLLVYRQRGKGGIQSAYVQDFGTVMMVLPQQQRHWTAEMACPEPRSRPHWSAGR